VVVLILAYCARGPGFDHHTVQTILCMKLFVLVLVVIKSGSFLYYVGICWFFDGRLGVVVGILAYYVRGRGFDSRTMLIFVCMNISLCIGSGCFYVCFYKKIHTKVCIYPLSKIHNTNPTNAYFDLVCV
jgi:hypothetical protein